MKELGVKNKKGSMLLNALIISIIVIVLLFVVYLFFISLANNVSKRVNMIETENLNFLNTIGNLFSLEWLSSEGLYIFYFILAVIIIGIIIGIFLLSKKSLRKKKRKIKR